MAADSKTSRSLRSFSVAALVNTVIIILLFFIQFKSGMWKRWKGQIFVGAVKGYSFHFGHS